jgi:hypothetical protein
MPTKRAASRRTGGAKRVTQKRAKSENRSAGAAAPSAASRKRRPTLQAQKKKRSAATAKPFTAEFFPLPPVTAFSHEHHLKIRSSAANFVGVCFSGGGSRALSAAMGQLRGLKYLGLLDDVFFISSVSGGTWASATYTYLPPQYDDDDFLGLVVEPGQLTYWNWNPQHPEYALDYLSPNNLGHVPPTLGIFNDLDAILQLKATYGYQNSELWQGLIGSLILARWGLWNPDDNGFPTQYYTLTPAYLSWKGGILDRNKQLKADQFYCIQRQRPFYVMNGCIVSNPNVEGAQLLYFESTPVGLGVRNYFPGIGPGGRDIGGGLLQPFAMGSEWLKDISGQYASVGVPPRPFSLSDMVSISSAAFAETIQESYPILDGLIPTYPYWPVQGRGLAKNTVYTYEFADGGSLEDTGITSLLNRGLPNIIAFVNGQTPLTTDDTGQIVIDAQIQLLFGIQPSAASLKYNEAKRRDVPNDDVTFTQVFASSYYDELAQGLWAANSAPYSGTAMYLQTMPVLPNANFGIQGNYNVRVLWVYNTWVDAWYDLLTDELVAAYADAEAELNFPNYDTVLQLNLSARQVNLLANLSCWNVMSDTHTGPQGMTNAQMVAAMFYG